MANNYFQFKQFTVHQDQCAMKICTDACIFGVYIARRISLHQPTVNTILDIGAGTGLLSLMLAQKTNAALDAVEIDEVAYQQARQNFEQSRWKNRLSIFNTDALLFQPGKKYDCIISNPPFFEGDLKSGDKKRNAAKHDSTLTLEQLLQVITRHLRPAGLFAVLLPYHRSGFFIETAAAAHYMLNEQLLVQHTVRHPYFRSILIFSQGISAAARHELVIKNNEGKYTREFNGLLEDYYL